VKTHAVALVRRGNGKPAEADAENMNSPELQRSGWQAILDNFKRYAEN